MAPVEISIKVSATDTFTVPIDDEEDVECLAVVIMTMREDIGEELTLIHKGKFLKEDQVIKDLGLGPTDFLAVVAKKKPAAQSAGYVATQSSGQAAPAPAAPAAPAAAAPECNVPSGQVGGEPDEAMVGQLCGMGFERDQVVKALRAAFNNADRAAEFLLSGNIPAIEPATEQQPQAPSMGGGVQGLLGPQLLTKTGLKPTAEALEGVDVALLYFSAHWCPPCRAFTPSLASAFKYGTPPSNLAVVFVSGDRDENSFQQYYNEMPWLAMPFSNPMRQQLGAVFGVRGIPSVVVLNAKTGTAISTNGREDVSSKGFDLRACMQGWGFPPAAAAPAAAPALPMPEKKAKTEETEPGPPPVPVDDEKARAALDRVSAESWEVQDAFFKTGIKVLNNVLSSPSDEKFRSLKRTNAALKSKLLDVAENAGTDLIVLAGFQISSDELLSMSAEPDGRCSEVRNRLKAGHTKAWEKQARKERDEKIAQEIEKDKAAGGPRYYGGDGAGGGRATYGADRKPRGGG